MNFASDLFARDAQSRGQNKTQYLVADRHKSSENGVLMTGKPTVERSLNTVRRARFPPQNALIAAIWSHTSAEDDNSQSTAGALVKLTLAMKLALTS